MRQSKPIAYLRDFVYKAEGNITIRERIGFCNEK